MATTRQGLLPSDLEATARQGRPPARSRNPASSAAACARRRSPPPSTPCRTSPSFSEQTAAVRWVLARSCLAACGRRARRRQEKFPVELPRPPTITCGAPVQMRMPDGQFFVLVKDRRFDFPKFCKSSAFSTVKYGMSCLYVV
ncbi:hypothetical protein ACP70R_002974 [Stipagrostis hirtigluma subsp. patula]